LNGRRCDSAALKGTFVFAISWHPAYASKYIYYAYPLSDPAVLSLTAITSSAMRLINTDPERMVLKDFFGTNVPPYATLSHCWGSVEDEITFQQFQAGQNRGSSGHQKIVECCRLARSQGLDWAWVDTCCIDKTSSAELSESINSMFAWYKDAVVCYAFLENLGPRVEH
jgi:hypothetical protein